MAKHLFRSKRVPFVDFRIADAQLEETLENLDCAENYAGWIFDLVEPHLGGEVLEVGAGHGTFTQRLATIADRVVAIDPSSRCFELLQERYSADPKIEVLQGAIGEAAARGPFDSAVLINVLEHIEDDNAALDALFGLLKPGSRLILWVPAFRALYSDYDRRIGHYRRYTKPALERQLARCGYEVLDIRYVNTLGAIAWLVMARLLRLTPSTGAPVKIFDRYLAPVLNRIERRYRPPFGQSVFAVAVRPST